MPRLYIFLITLILFLCCVGASAADLSVDIQDASCDDSVGSPYCTISAAIAAGADSDSVTVMPGLYEENVNFDGKDILLISADGPDDTEINGLGATTVVIGPGGHIEGFTISGGVDSFGAGMDVIGTGALVVGNIFDGNVQTSGGYGAGIGGNNASPTIDRNIFRNHSCDTQFLSGVISFVNGSSPVITNNLFIDNNCRGTNMTLPTGFQPEVINNTFINNRTAIYIDRRVPTLGQRYRNNIIFNNTIGVEVNFGTEANNPVFANNLVFGNGTDYQGILDQTGSDGNLAVDPLIADFTNGDYRPMATSPAIDAGFDQSPLATDFLNNPRPIDGNDDSVATADIGAYEAYPPQARAGADFTVDGGITAFLDAGASSDQDGVIATFLWTQSSGAGVTITNADSVTANFVAPSAGGNLEFTVSVTDDLGFTDTDSVSVTVNAVQVPTTSSGGGGGGGSLDVLAIILLFASTISATSRQSRKGAR